jgi:hypothetical protein
VADVRVTSPDGREWRVSVSRLRLPSWNPSDYDRWIEAECRWPSDIRIVWRTSRDQAVGDAAHIVTQLERGYENPGGVRVSYGSHRS